MNITTHNPELVVFYAFVAFMATWLSKMFLNEAFMRVQLTVSAVGATILTVVLGYFFGILAVVPFLALTLFGEAFMYFSMRSFEKKRKADEAFFKVAGYLAGASAKRQ